MDQKDERILDEMPPGKDRYNVNRAKRIHRKVPLYDDDIGFLLWFLLLSEDRLRAAFIERIRTDSKRFTEVMHQLRGLDSDVLTPPKKG